MRSGIFLLLSILTLGYLFVGCNSSLTSSSKDAELPTYSATVSWTPNVEKAVNQSGGGYRIYYSTTSGFALADGKFMSAPYVSGSTAPTSATVTGLLAGTYYFKVVAFSALPSLNDPNSSVSEPSSESSVTVP